MGINVRTLLQSLCVFLMSNINPASSFFNPLFNLATKKCKTYSILFNHHAGFSFLRVCVCFPFSSSYILVSVP